MFSLQRTHWLLRESWYGRQGRRDCLVLIVATRAGKVRQEGGFEVSGRSGVRGYCRINADKGMGQRPTEDYGRAQEANRERHPHGRGPPSFPGTGDRAAVANVACPQRCSLRSELVPSINSSLHRIVRG